jgi:hypothetical protein
MEFTARQLHGLLSARIELRPEAYNLGAQAAPRDGERLPGLTIVVSHYRKCRYQQLRSAVPHSARDNE